MPKATLHIIVNRTYQKGDQFQAVIVREESGGDIDGSMFRFEIWKNNVEDTSARETSGNIYHIRNRYFAKLLDFMEQGWKKTNAGVFANKHQSFFNPEAL